MKRTKQSESLPIDEVDAQTLYMVIRELHARKKWGLLLSARNYIGELIEGENSWEDHKGVATSSQTEQ